MTGTDTMLEQSVTRLFEKYCTNELILASEKGIFPDDLWGEVGELGLIEALVEEEFGGFGLSLDEAFEVARLAGRFALPLPLPETMLANRILASAGLATYSKPAVIVSSSELTLDRSDAGWVLSGSAPRVPWGSHAICVVLVPYSDQLFIACVEPEVIDAKKGENIAREPRDNLSFNTLIDDENVREVSQDVTLGRMRLFTATLRCSQMAGAIERVCEMTIAYTLERVQFGRPIAKFQAIQQNMALLAGETAAARVAADMAVAALSDGGDAELAVAAAKTRIGEAASQVAAISHQVHGAMGFTQEYTLNFLTRRLWSWRDEIGNEAEWAQLLGRTFSSKGADRLWPTITSL